MLHENLAQPTTWDGSAPRTQRLADQWLAHTEADMARGQYIDPRAARVTFQWYAETWVSTQGADPNTQASMES